MTAVNKFSESEKDRLKDLNLKFLKDEKALGKNSKRSGVINLIRIDSYIT